MPDAPSTTIVIVTYNSMRLIDDTLRTAQRCADAGLAKCVVVDNESKDGTADHIASAFPFVNLVRSGGNLGFGRGNNRGFEEVDTKYTLFLNPDARCEPDALKTMIDFMDAHPDAGVCGPAGKLTEGGLHAAGRAPTPGMVLRDALGRTRPSDLAAPIEPGSAPQQVEWIPGAALMFSSQVFLALGGFDPRFFLYWEETDLLLRVREYGAQVWAVGTAVIDHVGGASAAGENRNMYRGCLAEHYFQSRFYYLSKHYGRRGAYAVEVGETALFALRALPQRLRGRTRSMLEERMTGPFFEMPRLP
ncbi:MAG: glycosyltransferase family 2 protein [Deltaproteobacteria bacterium]